MTDIQKQELLRERATGIGGSDLAHLFCVEPYGCQRRLAYEKSGAAPDHPFHGNQATMRGERLEEFVVSEYVLQTGRTVRRSRMRRHKEDEHLIVHVDRVIVGDARGPGCLEVKCPGRESFYRQKRNGLSEAYILQLQHGMLVTGWTWGSFAVFNADSFELVWFDVEADAAIQSSIRSAAAYFWNVVAKIKEDPGNPELLPPRLHHSSRACQRCEFRTTCQGQAILDEIDNYCEIGKSLTAVATAAGLEVPDAAIIDESLQPLVDAYLESKTLRDEAESLHEASLNALRDAMGGRTKAKTTSATIVYAVHEQRRLDVAALRKREPEIAAKYELRSLVRPLRVFPT